MTKLTLQSMLGTVGISVLTLACAQAVAADAETGQLEEIVVTAQKRSENLQNASVSVDALRPNEIADAGIRNAIDLQELLPTVRFVAADQMTVLIRGLGTVNDNAGVDSAVAYSQDGIYLAHPEALTPVLFDIQRVEAVLGPQGTLYGRNSNGGVINFITNDPGPLFGGSVRLGGGNFSAFNSEAVLNVPLSDAWALRIAGGTEKHASYVSDGSNDVDAQAGRVKLLYKSDNFKALFAIDAAERRSVGASYGGLCPPGNIAPACLGIPWRPWAGDPPHARSAYNNDSIFGASMTLDYDLGWSSLTSLSGFKSYNFKGDTSPGWYGGIDHFDYVHHDGSRFFTQEVRLTSEAGSKIGWVSGVFYSHESQPAGTDSIYRDTILQQLYGLPANYYQKLDIISSDYQSEAVFGDFTVPVVGALRFRGGLRLTHESKDAVGTAQLGIEGVPGFPFGPLQTNEASESITRVTWKTGLDYDLTPHNLLYVTVSTGFKSGGVNNLPTAVGLSTYLPETIKAVELGSKNRFLEDRLQINASVFHYGYKNYQNFTFYTPTGGPLAGSTLFPTVNSQTATFEGGELQTTFALTAADIVGLDLNVLHNRFNEFFVALPYAPVLDLSNTDVPLSPKERVGLNYQHTFKFSGGASFSVAANSEWVASSIVYGNQGPTTNNALYTQGSYHKSGANLNYQTGEGGWKISAFIRNIENKDVINTVSGGYPVVPNLNLVNAMIDPPRTYGLAVQKDF